jgi:hypothetical protein
MRWGGTEKEMMMDRSEIKGYLLPPNCLCLKLGRQVKQSVRKERDLAPLCAFVFHSLASIPFIATSTLYNYNHTLQENTNCSKHDEKDNRGQDHKDTDATLF